MTSNPFSTRFIRPGALAYLFPPGESAELLVNRLRENNWSGQIIGPHGSGKSTLLAALIPALEAAGRQVIHCRMSNVEGPMSRTDNNPQTFDLQPSTFDLAKFSLDAMSQLIIDGFEQLSWLTRRRVKHACAKHQAGLLITAHRALGLPMLYATEPTLELTRVVVARLMPDGDNSLAASDVATAYQTTGGNIRETLFQLYDVYQRKNGHETGDS